MKSSNMIWGIILIILGLIIGLNALEITNLDLFFDGWWTLFMIVPASVGLLKGKELTSNTIWLVIGVVLLLACNDLISFELIGKLLLPFILITIGISILFKDTINSKIRNRIKNIKVNNEEEFYAVFGSNTIKPTEKEINGASINSIFGEIKCDLINTKITKDIVINATSVFGGMTILVPDDVNVVTSVLPLFGEVNNQTNNKDKSNTIYIRGTVMFGGISIK